MELFAGVVGEDSVRAVYEVPAADLRAGMVLAEDVRSERGGLLIAGGQPVTEQMAERVRTLRPGLVREPLRVISADG